MSVANNGKATKKPGGVTGRGFAPGQSGNPKGRAAVPPEVRAALAADTLEHYREAKRLIAEAEQAGDLKTALTGRLALLKKTVPDASELVISVPDGLEVRDTRIDLKRLDTDEAKQLAALVAKASAAKEGA